MKIQLRGFEIAYDDTGGTAIPLLLIHGFPLDRTLWTMQLRGLADTARVIAPDLRGFGESSLPTSKMTMDAYAEDLRGLLDRLNISTVVVAGLSMGGYIAFAFYRKYTKYVRALILADTRANPDSPEMKKVRDENVIVAREQGVAEIARRMLPKMLTAQTIATQPDITNAATNMMSRQHVEGVARALVALRDRPDSTRALARIAVPTLIVVGEQDTLTTPQDAAAMGEAIQGARLAFIPGAAHLSNFEQPIAFNQITRTFLRSLS